MIRVRSAAVRRFQAQLSEEYAARFPLSQARTSDHALLDHTSHSIRWNEPFAVTIQSAAGATLEDLDGHSLVDYWQGHFANLLGHNPRLIRDALASSLQAGQGLQTGMLHAVEAEVAQLLCRQTGMETCRFTTSGTLSSFYAVLLARAFTGRSGILKVSGGWHGSQPFGLKGVSYRPPGSTALDSEGLGAELKADISLVRFNDTADLRRLFRERGDQLACLLLEPWLGAGGGIAARGEFLREARRLTEQHGTLLICDEIITGFRFRPGDVSAAYDVHPDLLLLGKVIGGGMPLAAVLGRRDVLELCARASGRVRFEGGTFSGHELCMRAALTLLQHLVEHADEVYPVLAEKGAWLRREVVRQLAAAGVTAWVAGGPTPEVEGSSLAMLHFLRGGLPEPTSLEELRDPERRHAVLDGELWKSVMLLEGVHVRQGLGVVTLAHEPDHLQRTVDAVAAACERFQAAGLL